MGVLLSQLLVLLSEIIPKTVKLSPNFAANWFVIFITAPNEIRFVLPRWYI